MLFGLYGIVIMTLLINQILGMDPFFGQVQTLYIIVVLIPLSAITCLAKPSENAIMKVHVVSPKYMTVLNSTWLMVKRNFIKVFLAAILLTSTKIMQLYIIHRKFKSQHQRDRLSTDDTPHILPILGNLVNSKDHDYWHDSLLMMQATNYLLFILLLSLLQCGFELPSKMKNFDSKEKDDSFNSVNTQWRVQLVVQILIAVVYFVAQFFSVTSSGADSGFDSPYRSWEILMALVVFVVGFVILLIF
jgi:hypothetical protein